MENDNLLVPDLKNLDFSFEDQENKEDVKDETVTQEVTDLDEEGEENLTQENDEETDDDTDLENEEGKDEENNEEEQFGITDVFAELSEQGIIPEIPEGLDVSTVEDLKSYVETIVETTKEEAINEFIKTLPEDKKLLFSLPESYSIDPIKKDIISIDFDNVDYEDVDLLGDLIVKKMTLLGFSNEEIDKKFELLNSNEELTQNEIKETIRYLQSVKENYVKEEDFKVKQHLAEQERFEAAQREEARRSFYSINNVSGLKIDEKAKTEMASFIFDVDPKTKNTKLNEALLDPDTISTIAYLKANNLTLEDIYLEGAKSQMKKTQMVLNSKNNSKLGKSPSAKGNGDTNLFASYNFE